MGASEDRLTPATRNYVIFGLLFVVAGALAVCEWVNPQTRRGEPDSALRLLIVSDARPGLVSAMIDADGFFTVQLEPATVIDGGRELLKDPAAPAYQAALTYADQHGYGFLALRLHEDASVDGEAAGDVSSEGVASVDWGLSGDLQPAQRARFAVFSVGDVAVKGPRVHSVSPPDTVELAPALADLDGLRLALYDHPDLRRLWTIEPNAAELQARQTLASRGIDERHAQLRRDHKAWRDVSATWPEPGSIDGNLAAPQESVRATPIRDGLLLEVRRLRIHVDIYRRPRLERDETASLYFLPAAALGGADPAAARQRCQGLPEEIEGEITADPRGATVLVPREAGISEVFVLEGACVARSLGLTSVDVPPNASLSSTGAFTGAGGLDWLHWWDARGGHRVTLPGVSVRDAKPRWINDELLGVIGERSAETVLVLHGAAVHGEPVDVVLGPQELFPQLDPESDTARLIDLRPSGSNELLLVTQRCADAASRDRRPCLHRLTGDVYVSLSHERRNEPTASSTLETLGPLGPYDELAIAPDGSRAVWIDGEGTLLGADLRGLDPLVPQPLVPLGSAGHRHHAPRISADGQIVTAEIELEVTLGGQSLGSVAVARAIVLDPVPVDLARASAQPE